MADFKWQTVAVMQWELTFKGSPLGTVWCLKSAKLDGKEVERSEVPELVKLLGFDELDVLFGNVEEKKWELI
jgi:hypothetical protein